MLFPVILTGFLTLWALLCLFETWRRESERMRARAQRRQKERKAERDRQLMRQRAHKEQSERARLRALFEGEPYLQGLCAPRPKLRGRIDR